MKSDVIRKRSRHDARRGGGGGGNSTEDTPSASPGVSRRTSPVREVSPTLAPDSTTQITYTYNEEEMEYRSSQSELMGALGQDHSQNSIFHNALHMPFPGPYHPDYLSQLCNLATTEALPFASVDAADIDGSMSPRSNKRRRMSTDSASEPPSSAVSFSSYNDGYSSASSATSHSQRSSMDFPFSSYPSASTYSNGPALRGSGNTFWHPPMMPQAENSPHLFHPPMLPPDDSPMDYLHPPMAAQEEENLFSAYLHPPMALPDENSQMNIHPPMMYPADYSNNETYDSSMRNY